MLIDPVAIFRSQHGVGALRGVALRPSEGDYVTVVGWCGHTEQPSPAPFARRRSRSPPQLDMKVSPIKLSYHGQSHYNSVRDHSLRYPLQPRRCLCVCVCVTKIRAKRSQTSSKKARMGEILYVQQ